jgi:glycosyltransferase involved in cell wall biosynthesis
VCDFLAPALNLPDLRRSVLFQHNVETLVWRRNAATEHRFLRRLFFRREAARCFRHEGAVCRAVKNVVTVSAQDAEGISKLFGRSDYVSTVPTGVDCEYFRRPDSVAAMFDLVFLGSMDYKPNVDGMLYFVREIWPKICETHPDCSLGIVGGAPFPEIRRLAECDTRIKVTGTVPDVRPYLWGSRVSIVPLRVGGARV